jgi:hypothetical protein
LPPKDWNLITTDWTNVPNGSLWLDEHDVLWCYNGDWGDWQVSDEWEAYWKERRRGSVPADTPGSRYYDSDDVLRSPRDSDLRPSMRELEPEGESMGTMGT